MARSRIDFDNFLRDVFGSDVRVYYQPPTNISQQPGEEGLIQFEYPAVLYSLSDVDINSADNSNYIVNKEYTITAVTDDPDSDIPDTLLKIPGIRFNRHYIVDGLYHDVYNLYF